MIGLTARQQQCLDFLRSYHAEKGFTPTLQEIADHLGYASKSHVHIILKALQERGAIRLHRRLARSIEFITPEMMQAVLLSKEVFSLVQVYAASQRISVDTAVSEIVREAMGAA